MAKEVIFDYIPTEKQILFHNSPNKISLFGGAVGGGKTAAIASEAVIKCMQYNMDIIMGRADFSDFRDTTMVELQHRLPSELYSSWNKSLQKIVFKPNKYAINAKPRIIDGKYLPGRTEPSTILMKPLDDPESLKSLNLGYVLIDELSGVPKEAFDMLLSRLREKSMHYTEHKLKAASNPVANWVKTLFITMPHTPEEADCKLTPDPYNLCADEHCANCKIGCRIGKNVAFIPSFIKDNPYLPPNYSASLRSFYSKELADMLLSGSWELLGGAVFPEVAVLKYEPVFQIPLDWPRYMAIDPHTRTPTHALWCAVSPAGFIYVYRELIVSETVKNICSMIKAKEQGEQIFFRIIDTSANSTDELTGLNIMDEFSRHGVPCVGAAKGNHIGYTRIKEALGANRIRVFDTCPNFMNQWKHLKWDDYASKLTGLRKEEMQTWVKKDDHLFDCFKYIMIANPKYVPLHSWVSAYNKTQEDMKEAMAHFNVKIV